MFLKNKIIIIGSLITVPLIMIGCYKESDYYFSPQEILNKLQLDISNKTIPADGNSTSKFTFQFPLNSDTGITGLRLITSSGSFLESKNDTLETNFTRLDSSETYRYVEATLISSAIVTDCIVRTQLLNYERKDTVHFALANPSNISLSSDAFYAKNDTIKQFILTASVASGSGIASKGTIISFSFHPEVGFLNKSIVPSDSQGKAQAIFVLTDTTYVGDLNFTVTTNNTTGNSFTDTGTIKIIE